MRALFTSLAIVYAGIMLMAGSEPRQALSLEVEEAANSVAVHLVALSPVSQKVDYTVELTGTSRSRHSGSTTIPANERRVLSQMRTGFADNWCARVQVQEERGAAYTLTAGECAEG